MLFLLTNRVRPGLTATQFAELATLAKAFYAAVPSNVQLKGEWAALDRSCNFSLIEAPDLATVERLHQPFTAYTLSEIVPVRAIEGWVAS